MPYDLQVIKMGQCEVPKPEVYWMSHWNSREHLYFWMILIRGNGKNIIINTGPPRDLAPMNRAWSEAVDPRSQFVRCSEEQPQEALARYGLSPGDIDYVLITPSQAYATGNIQIFRNATVCIPRGGRIEDFHAPKFSMHIPRKLRIPDETLQYLGSRRRRDFACWKTRRRFYPGYAPFGRGFITGLRWPT
jgi:glyoxylase-like metal-dependent hydrolase (beta-lactamase superfamily II)